MKHAFTLIELLIVIAILGILAAAVLVAINPGKRIAQSRDAQRRQDVNTIANELIAYYTTYGRYPAERYCDSSVGSTASPTLCSSAGNTNWSTAANSYIYQEIIVREKTFKNNLPIDPSNGSTYFYRYEPRNTTTDDSCGNAELTCEYYWIGGLLESPTDPAKPIFRCSDDPLLITEGMGCKEVSGDMNQFPQILDPS